MAFPGQLHIYNLKGNMLLLTMPCFFRPCLYRTNIDLGTATSYNCQFNTGYFATYNTASSIMLPLDTTFVCVCVLT